MPIMLRWVQFLFLTILFLYYITDTFITVAIVNNVTDMIGFQFWAGFVFLTTLRLKVQV